MIAVFAWSVSHVSNIRLVLSQFRGNFVEENAPAWKGLWRLSTSQFSKSFLACFLFLFTFTVCSVIVHTDCAVMRSSALFNAGKVLRPLRNESADAFIRAVFIRYSHFLEVLAS